MKALGVILGIVLICVGIMLWPIIKEFTDTIFGTMSNMDPALTALVSMFVFLILAGFVVGAYILARRGQ